MSAWQTMRAAVGEAEATFRAADDFAETMAALLVGRLRHVSSRHLAALKRELRAFDAQQKVWKP